MGHYNSEMTITGSRSGDEAWFRQKRAKDKEKLEKVLLKHNTNFNEFKIGSKIRLRKGFDRFSLHTYGYDDLTALAFSHSEVKVCKVDKKHKLIFIKGILGYNFGIDFRFLKIIQ